MKIKTTKLNRRRSLTGFIIIVFINLLSLCCYLLNRTQHLQLYKTNLTLFHTPETKIFFRLQLLIIIFKLRNIEMEGVGSTRLGRASARYGGSTAVFNGPVRKWKKKWVHVSPSSTAKLSHSNGNGSAASSILLCRWTPLSFADSGSSAVDGEDEEQPPKRKYRYTPVSVCVCV